MKGRGWLAMAAAVGTVMAGCESDRIQAPAAGRVLHSALAGLASDDEPEHFLPCDSHGACYTPDFVAAVQPIHIDFDAFAKGRRGGNCSVEACDSLLGTFTGILTDEQGGYDFARYDCGAGLVKGKYSWATCWECTNSCADPAYVDSIASLPQHQGWMVFSVVMKYGPPGPDCQIRRCPAGYSLLESASDTSRASICYAPDPSPAVASGAVQNGKPLLSWGTVANSTAEFVERYVATLGGGWETLGGPQQSPYSDNVSVSGTTQSSQPASGNWVGYRVRSSGVAASEWSQVVYFTTVPPPTPSVTAATRRTSLVTINWGSSTGASSIEVERQYDHQTAWEVVWQSLSSSSGSYLPGDPAITGSPQSSPPSGTWVRYRVRALSPYANSGYSAPVYFRLADEGPE